MVRNMVAIGRRLYKTADGEVVDVSDGRPKSLFCLPGQQIPREEAARLGLLGDDESPADPEPEPESDPEPEPEPESDPEPEPEPDPEPEGGGLEGNYFSADEPPANPHVCEECGYESTTAAGLGAHRRIHKAAE